MAFSLFGVEIISFSREEPCLLWVPCQTETAWAVFLPFLLMIFHFELVVTIEVKVSLKEIEVLA